MLIRRYTGVARTEYRDEVGAEYEVCNEVVYYSDMVGWKEKIRCIWFGDDELNV